MICVNRPEFCDTISVVIIEHCFFLYPV